MELKKNVYERGDLFGYCEINCKSCSGHLRDWQERKCLFSLSFLKIFFFNVDCFLSLHSTCNNIASVVYVLVFWP